MFAQVHLDGQCVLSIKTAITWNCCSESWDSPEQIKNLPVTIFILPLLPLGKQDLWPTSATNMLLFLTTESVTDNYKRLEKTGYDNFDPVSLSFTFINTPQGTVPISRELIANWRYVPLQTERVHEVLTRRLLTSFWWSNISVCLDFSPQSPKSTLESFLKNIVKYSSPYKIRINQSNLSPKWTDH